MDGAEQAGTEGTTYLVRNVGIKIKFPTPQKENHMPISLWEHAANPQQNITKLNTIIH